MVLEKSGQHLIANAYQIRFRIKVEGIEMEEELENEEQKETYDFNSEIEQSMKESNNEPLEETDEKK